MTFLLCLVLLCTVSQAVTDCALALDQIKELVDELNNMLKQHMIADHACISNSNSITTQKTAPSYLYFDHKTIFKLPSFEKLECQQDFPPPGIMFGSAAVVPYNGTDSLMVCGGERSEYGCYVWLQSGWKLTETEFYRYHLGSSVLADGRWLVSGGRDSRPDHRHLTSSTRIYEDRIGWQDFFPFPETRSHHCQVTVGESVYSIGGLYLEPVGGPEPDQRIVSQVYVSNNNQNWTVLDFSLQESRALHSCAVLNGRIYVIGGVSQGRKNEYGRADILQRSSVEIFDPSNPSSWSFGPQFPVPSEWSHALVYENTIFVLVPIVVDPEDKRRVFQTTRVFSLAEGEDEWRMVMDIPGLWEGLGPRGPSILRRFFPAPVVTSNTLHCKN